MRKIILSLMLVLSVVLASCSSCSSNNEEQQQEEENINVTEEQKAETLVLENTISTDREFMFLVYGRDYRWFESSLKVTDFLDSDSCQGTISEVTNIFQVITEVGSGYDTHVIMITHTPDTSWVDVYNSFWVEDWPLNDEEITVTFEDAFKRIQEANCPKPHSKCCVLRCEVGPNPTNAQYIFGNRRAQLYVDAVTGDVNENDPVFPDASFNGPLGEWP